MLKAGKALSKQYINTHPGPFPVIGAAQQPLGFVNTYNTEDPLGITGAGTVGHLTWCEGKYFRTDHNWSCPPKQPDLLLPRYLYHLLTDMHRELHALASHDGIPRLNQCNLAKLIIPIPALKHQQDIVTKLDTLTELEAQMQRYRYLRRQLLDFNGNVTIKALGEICTVKTGKALSKKYINTHPGPFPVISNAAGIAGYVDQWNSDDAPLGIVRSGSPGELTWCEDKHFRTHDNYACTIIDPAHTSERYLFHLLSHMQPQLQALAYGVVPYLNHKPLSRFKVPIPPLKVQTAIVETLDPYHALIHDLGQGIPGEIAGRKQQLKFLRTEMFKPYLLDLNQSKEDTPPIHHDMAA